MIERLRATLPPMRRTQTAVLFIAQLLFSELLFAQTGAGLPLGLDYSMTKAQVTKHLVAMESHRIQTGKPNTVAYVVVAPDSRT